jgi:hypothetical protein
MESLRHKQLRSKYRDRVVNQGEVTGAGWNNKADVVLISNCRLGAGGRAIDRLAAGRREIQLLQNRWINAGATRSSINQALYLNRLRDVQSCREKGIAPGLACSDERNDDQAAVWRYLASEVWHGGTNREMN